MYATLRDPELQISLLTYKHRSPNRPIVIASNGKVLPFTDQIPMSSSSLPTLSCRSSGPVRGSVRRLLPAHDDPSNAMLPQRLANDGAATSPGQTTAQAGSGSGRAASKSSSNHPPPTLSPVGSPHPSYSPLPPPPSLLYSHPCRGVRRRHPLAPAPLPIQKTRASKQDLDVDDTRAEWVVGSGLVVI